MKKSEFKTTVKIYKSHNLKNNFISITYASILGNNTVSEESTIEIEKEADDDADEDVQTEAREI